MKRLGRLALAAVLALGGPAAAQVKPPVAGGGAPAAPDKFAAPPPPSGAPQAAQPPADKFVAPSPPAPTPALPDASPAPRAAPPPRRAAPNAPPPVPANEPAAVARLRALLGPDTALAYRSAESLDPARGSVRLLGVSMDGRGRRVTMEELTLDGLRDDGVGEATARTVAMRDSRSNATIARLRLAGLSVQRPPPGAEFRPDMVRLDALRIEGLRMTGNSDATIAEFSVEEYGAGRVGRLSMSGFDIRVPRSGNRVAVARAALRGMDLAAGLAALVASEAPPRAQGSYGLEVEGLSVRDGNRPLGGFGTLRVSAEVPASGLETGSLALRDLRIEPFPGFAQWLRRFGYEALTADLSAESRYDRVSGRVELTSLSLSGREIAALGLSMVLDGMTPKAAERRDHTALRLVSATLRYVDQSLYGRYVRQQARETRVPEAQVRDEQAEMADMMLGSLGKGPGVDALRDAVGRFLRGEARGVEVTARPAVPLAFDEFGPGPPDAALLGRLGLGASAR
jgi:hypothetical protein